ncbi:DUF4011 domain-containing protein [Acetobacteraceae bacterium H6797]|nr:DUF4011 domain-containing protein [Acetobacteraceae bacterium H6797]
MDLDSARRALLDLSTRNRLLALPRGNRARSVVLAANPDLAALTSALEAGRSLSLEAGGMPAKPDTLQLNVPAADLQRRLRNLALDAKTVREETGAACLFVAIGALAWRDPATPDKERLAPIALLPVALERAGREQPFRLRSTGGRIQGNDCLIEKLRVTFGIEIPPVDPEEASPASWGAAVAQAVMGRPGFTLRPDVVALGLFAFDRFPMWRDLDPATNPGLLDHPVLRQLLGTDSPPPAAFALGEDIDALVPVERLDHVLPLDGSQALAVEAVRRGQSLVIQGPPGTGKSQVITAIIAQAVMDGRSVLFVAEKQAAIEVVERRLRNIGLGPALLSLPDPDVSRQAVMASLREALEPAPPSQEQALLPHREAIVTRLGALRGRLNRHAKAMGATIGEAGVPLAEVIGKLAQRRARNQPPAPLTLPAALWDRNALASHRAAAAELALRARQGASRSAWRGVTRRLTPIEQDALLAALPGWLRSLSAASADPEFAAMDPAALATALRHSATGRDAPAHDAATVKHPAWEKEVEQLAALARAVMSLAQARQEPTLRPGAETLEGLAEARQRLAAPRGMLSFLSPARRSAERIARQASNRPEHPLPAIDAALTIQQAQARLKAGEALGMAAFGTLWHGPAEAMQALVDWRLANGAEAMAALADPVSKQRQLVGQQAHEAVEALLAATGLDFSQAFGTAKPSLPLIANRLAEWATTPDGLPAWLGWQRAVMEAPALRGLAEMLERGAITPEAVPDAVEQAIEEALFNHALRADPSLAAFDGAAAAQMVAEFRATDSARAALARAEAAAAHAARVAQALEQSPDMALLRAEMGKKRGFLPLRSLFARASQALRAVKPVTMMSPLSVAQFLAPPHGMTPGTTFDLMVMDEASQVEPVEALGAIGRARQVVVVGDDKQMPPTRFFQRLAEDEAESEEEDEALVTPDEVESILGLMNARGMPSVMLRWHYRSRHESLIATSNAEFYEGRLVVLPSPAPRSPSLGLSLMRVQGRYEGAGVNRSEAQAIAWAIVNHARSNPGESLGVAAFSLRQRDAILDALEEVRASAPYSEPFFTAHPHEPFFVKNLENVQGDERDVMFISIGYGPDADGRFAMRFGPLSSQGGERRLNVLITRAKRRMTVFSSFAAADIDLNRATGRGVEALKTFLTVAEQGSVSIPGQNGEVVPLGRMIADAVSAAGLEARTRVGQAGAFIDVAAMKPEGAQLGIATDGPDWARLGSARDRDIGLPAALEGMGWRLHRAWHLSWLAQPEAERQRLFAALGAAPAAAPTAPVPMDIGLAEAYREAAPALPPGAELTQVPFASLAGLVMEIIRVEQPIHGEAIAERLRLARGGAALNGAEGQAVVQALMLARQLHGAREEGNFWSIEDRPVEPRDRRAAAAHLRHPALLPPAEIEAAARHLLRLSPRSTEAELAPGILRLLGLEESALPAVRARLAMLAGGGRLSFVA